MLALQVFSDSALTWMLADFTSRIHPPDGGGLRLSTNKHGFASLEAPFIPMTLSAAFDVYNWPGTPHAVVSDTAVGTVWEGRLEDVTIVPGGVSLTALGYQRALSDVPYTALWSATGSGNWKFVTYTQSSTYSSERYEADNNNRLYIAPRKGESFSSGGDKGGWSYAAPHNGSRDMTNISLDYVMVLPSGWRFLVESCLDDFSTFATENSVTATGGTDSGSLSLTLATPRPRIIVRITNQTGSTSTISSDTGVNYIRITNIRVKTTTSSTVLASAVATALTSAVNTANADQLSTDASLIEATTTDLQDELYEDEWPADILDRLALLHNYEWGVYEGRRLHFRAKGSAGRAWYVDVTDIVNLQRSLENVRNSAYGVYRDADGGRLLRTANVGDTDSQTRYGIVRRGFVSVQSTSLSEAQTHRSAYLDDRADASARAEIRFSRLYDESGSEYPLYALRAGDTVTMRNLPPTLSATVDRIRSFVVGETDYSAERDEIDVTPEDATPTLERLVARRGAGLR